MYRRQASCGVMLRHAMETHRPQPTPTQASSIYLPTHLLSSCPMDGRPTSLKKKHQRRGRATDLCIYAKFLQCADHRVLQRFHVGARPLPQAPKVDDGVSHQLSGSVEGGLTTPAHTKHLRSLPPQLLLRDQEVLVLAPLSQGVDGEVLQTAGDCHFTAKMLLRFGCNIVELRSMCPGVVQ